MDDVGLRMTWLHVNQAYAFTFGDQLVRIENGPYSPLLFDTADEAVYAANRVGLDVGKSGVVFTKGQEK